MAVIMWSHTHDIIRVPGIPKDDTVSNSQPHEPNFNRTRPAIFSVLTGPGSNFISLENEFGTAAATKLLLMLLESFRQRGRLAPYG